MSSITYRKVALLFGALLLFSMTTFAENSSSADTSRAQLQSGPRSESRTLQEQNYFDSKQVQCYSKSLRSSRFKERKYKYMCYRAIKHAEIFGQCHFFKSKPTTAEGQGYAINFKSIAQKAGMINLLGQGKYSDARKAPYGSILVFANDHDPKCKFKNPGECSHIEFKTRENGSPAYKSFYTRQIPRDEYARGHRRLVGIYVNENLWKAAAPQPDLQIRVASGGNN